MVELIKKFVKGTGNFFDFGNEKKSKLKSDVCPVLKTRAQIIKEGKSAYLPKRHIHGSPSVNKL